MEIEVEVVVIIHSIPTMAKGAREQTSTAIGNCPVRDSRSTKSSAPENRQLIMGPMMVLVRYTVEEKYRLNSRLHKALRTVSSFKSPIS